MIGYEIGYHGHQVTRDICSVKHLKLDMHFMSFFFTKTNCHGGQFKIPDWDITLATVRVGAAFLPEHASNYRPCKVL